MKNIISRVLAIALTGALISSCAASDYQIWGSQPARAEQMLNTLTPTDLPTLVPSITPSPSVTPLRELPMPGSATSTPEPTQTPDLSQLSSAELTASAGAPSATLPSVNNSGPMDVYTTQGGDTLAVLAKRFQLDVSQFVASVVLPAPDQLLPSGILLVMPKSDPLVKYGPADKTIPDSEFVYGPATIGFNSGDYIRQQNGYLATYMADLSSGKISGPDAVERIASENSINPKLILAVIEYESHWVLGNPTNLAQDEYPLGYVNYQYRNFFRQLMWASGQLSEGYYRWRSGDLTELTFKDGGRIRIDPRLNAASAAIQFYFSQNHTRTEWDQALTAGGFLALYTKMFGDPWLHAGSFEPAIPANLTQPALTLPFEPGKIWAFISGPHSAWEREGGALAALDLAPPSNAPGCIPSDYWVLAPAAGRVVRVGQGLVILDLDGDGFEQTGWDILFMHISNDGKVKLGQVLKTGDHIGHPSCEGGVATGTHLHIARKFNGEWILAGGPVPFNLGGWIAHNGNLPYQGTLTRDGVTVTANQYSDGKSHISWNQ